MDARPIMVALKTRFGPSTYNDPIGAFTKLLQHTTMEEYQTQFEILSNWISGLIGEFKVSTFHSGLKDEVWIVDTMFQPTTLSKVFSLARLQEEEVLRRNERHPSLLTLNPSPYHISKPNYSRLPAPPTLPRLLAPPLIVESHTNWQTPLIHQTLTIYRLTTNEMQERIDRGLFLLWWEIST